MRNTVWGTVDGREVSLFTLKNRNGIEARVMTYGATLVELIVPDRLGRFSNIVLNYDSLEHYRESRGYLGATIGRYANRIAGGRFVMNGQTYKVSCNEKNNMLHGGFSGFDKKLWTARIVRHASGVEALELSYLSPDGEEGFPGTLTLRVTFALSDQNELAIDYWAQSDRDTVLNQTNHSYFNLGGSHHESALDHELFLNAGHYLPVNAEMIPTGEIAPVEGTPFDFRQSKRIAADIHRVNEQLKYGKGYDLNWILNRETQNGMDLGAMLYEKNTGRVMEVLTTEPGIQFYSGNLLKSAAGPGARKYAAHTGVCLETQHFPDSPNHLDFPTAILRAGTMHSSSTVLRFSWEK